MTFRGVKFMVIFFSVSEAVESGTCVNTRTLLVLCLGAYCGLRYAGAYILGSGNLVTMATVSVPKKQKLRSLFSPRALLKRLIAAFWGDGENEPHVVGIGIKGVVVLVITYALFGGILECWVGSVLGALSPGGEFTTASVGPDVFPHAHNPREAASLPQVNATEDVAKLQQGLSWTTTVAAWQRLQVLADPVLLAVLTLVMAVLTVMLQLFHDLFALFVMQVRI
ncbi:hypothetical protein FHG87_024536 [Trinorchestia longiramus]|nr:hypothetical protein FHG87_024536 [Trinorchestia longiramus]